jgi:hypothetical protein
MLSPMGGTPIRLVWTIAMLCWTVKRLNLKIICCNLKMSNSFGGFGVCTCDRPVTGGFAVLMF